MTIPTHDKAGKVKIANQDPLEGLEGFDPKMRYGADKVETDSDGKTHYYRNGHEYRIMGDTQKQMGVISNLITDMTLGGASTDELARAVRHSMVVIDAEKHKLDYKASEIENNIAALRKEWQVKTDDDGNVIGYGGASTILSRSKGEVSVPKRQGTPVVNIKGSKNYDPSRPEGAVLYKTADDLYYPVRKMDKSTGMVTLQTIDGRKVTYNVNDKTARAMYEPVERKDPKTGAVSFTNREGNIVYKTDYRKQQSTRMAETDDAYSLVSSKRHPMELLYADYANAMKAMGNEARIEMMNTGNLKYDKKARDTYQTEVASLMSKLNTALLNAPREREAQRLANVEVAAKKEAAKANGTELKSSEIKKISQQALSKYRQEVGSVSRRDRSISITDKEWEAIQAGAVTENVLKRILDNADADNLRQRSMPRTTTQLSQAQINRIKAMSASYTIAEIAEKLGKSPSTIQKYLKGVN